MAVTCRAAGSAAGGHEGPALNAVDQEVAVWSERRIVEGLTWLCPAFVEVSIKPEAELAPARPNDQVLEAPLQSRRSRYYEKDLLITFSCQVGRSE